MNSETRTAVVMAGGTGGHIFPGLAVANSLRDLGWRVIWLGVPNGMETRLVPAQNFEMALVNFPPLRGKGIVRKLILPINLLRAFWQALKILRKLKPDVVIGMGGYVTFPGGMMASLLRKPLLIHEQNAIAGLANKLLSHIADRVLTGFPSVLKTGEYVGNPVRTEIATLPLPKERFGKRSGQLNLLVVGGSLGATVLNQVVPEALALLPQHERPKVIHQAGSQHIDQLKEKYRSLSLEAEVTAFIDDMASVYSWADWVICRAGALTIAELAAAGLGSVLVPYPYAVDDHQRINAEFLALSGASVIVNQEEFTPDRIVEFCRQPREKWLMMAEKARTLAKPDATERVTEICNRLLD